LRLPLRSRDYEQIALEGTRRRDLDGHPHEPRDAIRLPSYPAKNAQKVFSRS
jgi:hypothetical protein